MARLQRQKFEQSDDVRTTPQSVVKMVELGDRVVAHMATDYLDRQGSVLRDLAEVLVAAGRIDEAREALNQALETYSRKGATAPAANAQARLKELEELTDQPSRG